MFKMNAKRLLALLLAAIMVIGIMPVTAFATGATRNVTNYKDFMTYLKELEVYANEYHTKTPGSKDPGVLVLNFIRTGVERYQDSNWVTLAGQEETGFVNFVAAQDEINGTTAMCLRDIVIDDFTLPNGNQADFGHMFGCMNISYVAKGSADLSGWSGDICDLLQYSVSQLDDINKNTDGSVESMAAYIQENCFGVDASGAFGWDDFYGDMDAYYLITEYAKNNGSVSFSSLMEDYFTDSLNDTDRTVYFMNNRFAVADSQEAVRKAIYESYSADVAIKILESKRGLSSYNNLRQACCYAFADYVYSQAKGKLIEGTVESTGPANGYYTVFSNEHTILAPGIEQDINYAQTADGKQIVYYVATVEVNREDVDILVNYNNNAAPVGSNIGLQSVEKQVEALVKNNADKENFYPIVATNGAGYNITSGVPGGLVVMQGVEYYPVGAPGFFAILDDGTAVIGDQAKYNELKAENKVKEAIQAFGSVLVKDGKINVTKSANYTSNRASRTAIGITAEGKVVMMVLDGRQLPRSAGGAMEEIAQIMLEAGCVDAVNLDGGGSSTYLSKPAGSDQIELVNVPSDGYARSVSTSLVAVSTAAPSTAFDHAIITSDYEYITVGTSMQFNVTGVSNTGNAAVIPEGAFWRVSDESIATIDETGIFTALENGDVTVEYVIGDTVIGSKKIGVVIPDDFKFAEEVMTAVYGVPKEIDVTLWYQGYPVAFTPLVDTVVLFADTEDLVSDAGVIDGMTFTGFESSGIRTVKILGVLPVGEDVALKYATISLYKTDEATFDFANATQGNRKLAWNREIENAKTTNNELYRISDPDLPLEIEYTFALDITAIDFPPQLEPLKEKLPTYQEDATAWTYLLQLAERICVQTNVTIRAEFSKELDVDITNLKIINDYFNLTSANLDENNVLTIVCNWVNQSKPIDAATANPLCILSGITATVKDTAAYVNNEVLIANNGYVSYDIYLAASSLYSFAQESANQSKYGLYPYIHEEDCRSDFVTEDPGVGDENGDTTEDTNTEATNNDKGARFSSQYIDFADIFVVNNEIRNGWHEEGNDYYYYKNNEAVTGVQLVPDRHNVAQDRFYEFDETGKLVSEDGTTGLVTFENNLYYAVLGVAQTRWQQIDGNNYYFDPDTGKAVDGVYKIYEAANSWQTKWYTYTFEDHILVKGAWENDTYKGVSGIRYRWAGDWMKACWFEVDGKIYNVGKGYPYYVITGYGHYIKDYRDGQDTNGCYLFDDSGALMVDFNGAAYVEYTNSSGVEVGEYRYFVAGALYSTIGIAQGDDGYYYHVTGSGVVTTNAEATVNAYQAHGFVPAGTYNFDEKGRMKESLLDVEKKVEIPYSVQGRVVTVSNTEAVSKIGYYKDGVFVALEAMDNGNGGYNFAAPKDVNEVYLVVKGDVDSDGDADADDIEKIKEIVISGDLDLDTIDAFAADVNGDGRVTAADIAKINAASKGKTKIEW